jgi:imidazolonepropionase-like amidohydrolase
MRVPHRPEAGQCHDFSSEASKNRLFGIQADLLIPGRGEPITKGVIVIQNDRILWSGKATDLPSKYARVALTRVPLAMPGLWDVHTHFLGQDIATTSFASSSSEFLPGTETLIGAVIAGDLEATLMAGFTSVRECGGYAGYLAAAIDRGALVGPSVYSAIGILSITGGHGDRHHMPLETVVDSCRHGSPWAICDGPVDCAKMVRRMVRQGARVIKVCSTGGVLSVNDQPEDTQFSPEELKAIVDEAARSGRVVAAHAIGKPGIVAALEAGVKSIEHGQYLDKEVTDLMKEKDAILCPTRHIVECLASNPDQLDPKSKKKLERMLSLSRESLKFAIKEGVKIALGTDTYSSDRASNPCSHGTNAKELYWAIQAGMSPLQAIEMGTATPPETLGPQAPKSGQIKVGYDADIIAVCGNPLDDISVLLDSQNITHVWKGGRLVKAPAGTD